MKHERNRRRWLADALASLPARGAWIETSANRYAGGRVTVAPRTGGVD